MSNSHLKLSDPFPTDEIHFKPIVIRQNQALVIAYVNARTIMDRLDEVLSSSNWKDSYHVLPDGSVQCTLSCRLDGEWIDKSDVGSPSEQPDEGDRVKAAFSDALKRAAVKFGVGRYLYKLPSLWVDYDAKARQVLKVPALPEWAVPRISVAQNEQLRSLIKQSSTDPSKILKHFRIANLDELTNDQFAKCLKWLNKKLETVGVS